MDTKQLNDALSHLYVDDEARVVFWNDPDEEFGDFVSGLPFLNFGTTNVNVIKLNETGCLETKIRLEQKEPESKFLIYSPTEEPDYDDDWLLDVRLYSRSFRADRASIILDELGLANQHLREHLATRRKFFDNKERLHKLKQIVESPDHELDLDRKMIAVVTKSDQSELFTIVRTLFHAWSEVDDAEGISLADPPGIWAEVVKYDLEDAFWAMVKARFGYEEDVPSLRNFLIRLFVTDLEHCLHANLPGAYDHLVLPPVGRHNAIVCLAQWRDSASKGGSYDVVSELAALSLELEGQLVGLELDDLIGLQTFQAAEKIILRHLRDRVLDTKDAPDATGIREIALKRQDGHWASLQVAGDPSIPRQAFHAAYNALVAAADYQALKQTHSAGFASESPSALYRLYADDLFRFDQLYRHFCEAADEAEKQSWDLLKSLRERIEADYSQGFLKDLSLKWGPFVDPGGATALLKHWKIDGVKNQQHFFREHVQTRLDEAENRKAFVIISDALRYEAAQELSEELNGKYRFEAELRTQLGVLPSYTSLGMASLLPHEKLTYSDKVDVLADGKRTASIDQRTEILKRLEGAEGMACKADELIAMKKAEGRKFVEGHRVIYIYHNAIDVVGESAQEGQTFAAVRKAINELTALVSYVVDSLNGNYVVVTADHGFVFTESAPEETEKSPIKDKPPGTIKAKQRYLFGRNLGNHEAAWHGHTRDTAGADGDMEFWIPRGINRFHFQGSKQFVHGGAMLQEIVVPVIRIRHRKSKGSRSATKTKQVPVQVLGNNHKITTAKHRFQLLQMDAVSDRVKPITLKVGVYEGDDPVTNIETVTFESESSNMDDRKKWVTLVLKDQTYDRKTPYRLVLREAESGIEKAYADVIIDRVFTDDF